MLKVITSKDNNKIKHASSLKERKYREEYQEFLIEGFKMLEMAAKAGCIKEIFTTKEVEGINKEIPQYLVDETLIKKISSSVSPEGVVAICNMVHRKSKKMNKVVYLDKVNDPGNVGTIMRTAYAFNYDAIIFSKGSCDPYNEKAISGSRGSVFFLPILHGDLEEFKEDKDVIVSALNEKAIDIKEVKLPKSFILVVGNEANGVSQEVMKQATIVTKISINNIDSLNVAVATGILMDHLR